MIELEGYEVEFITDEYEKTPLVPSCDPRLRGVMWIAAELMEYAAAASWSTTSKTRDGFAEHIRRKTDELVALVGSFPDDQ